MKKKQRMPMLLYFHKGKYNFSFPHTTNIFPNSNILKLRIRPYAVTIKCYNGCSQPMSSVYFRAVSLKPIEILKNKW